MMTAQQLKNSILQRAIEGKLVEQRVEEGTAKELLKDIKLEKEKLVKEGKIKKSKPLPPITEDEIPFDIPDSWEWVRLNDVSISGLGKTLNKATDNGKIKPYLCSINIYWNGINFEKIKTNIKKYVIICVCKNSCWRKEYRMNDFYMIESAFDNKKELNI